MSKKLVLMRHGKAEEAGVGRQDHQRELLQEGRFNAIKMGQRIKELGFIPDFVISSDSRRTTDTAFLFAEQLGYASSDVVLEERIYEASVRVLMQILGKIEEQYTNVVLVGHNPGISFLADFLLSGDLEEMGTCNVVGLEFDINSWSELDKGIGKLMFYEKPEQF